MTDYTEVEERPIFHEDLLSEVPYGHVDEKKDKSLRNPL